MTLAKSMERFIASVMILQIFRYRHVSKLMAFSANMVAAVAAIWPQVYEIGTDAGAIFVTSILRSTGSNASQ
jgi:uncharacterized membrane protein